MASTVFPVPAPPNTVTRRLRCSPLEYPHLLGGEGDDPGLGVGDVVGQSAFDDDGRGEQAHDGLHLLGPEVGGEVPVRHHAVDESAGVGEVTPEQGDGGRCGRAEAAGAADIGEGDGVPGVEERQLGIGLAEEADQSVLRGRRLLVRVLDAVAP